jgi:protein TonB
MAVAAKVIMLHPRAARGDASASPAEQADAHSPPLAPTIPESDSATISGVRRSIQVLSKEPVRLVLAGSLLVSFVLHGFALLLLRQEPKPLASIGLPVISVEIVLGSNTPAGPATSPVQPETIDSVDALAPETQATEDKVAQVDPESARHSEPQPIRRSEPEVATLERAVSPQKTPVETVEESLVEITPPTVVAREASRPSQQADRKRQPEPVAVARPPRETVRTRRPDNVDRTGRSAAVSNPANGVGRGRSDAHTNYPGLVAAHLARHKPPATREEANQGRARISFQIDGRGNVTSVRLIGGTGSASLDQEAQAMVRRASPFPPPPNGQPMSFNVPLNFKSR